MMKSVIINRAPDCDGTASNFEVTMRYSGG